MSAHKGPYTAHVRFKARPAIGRLPERPAHTTSQERKTFKAAENFLSYFAVNVEAGWITNAAGVVPSPFAFGNPDPLLQPEHKA